MGVPTLTSDDALQQAAQAAWSTRLAAPVAHLLDDILSGGGDAAFRTLTFVGPTGPLSIRLEVAADGLVSMQVMTQSADAVEVWGPDGLVARLHQSAGGWSANVDVSGPLRVLCVSGQSSSRTVLCQTEWFSVP